MMTWVSAVFYEKYKKEILIKMAYLKILGLRGWMSSMNNIKELGHISWDLFVLVYSQDM